MTNKRSKIQKIPLANPDEGSKSQPLGVLARSVSTPLRVPRKQVIQPDLLDIPTGPSERKEKIAR
jgi:hypothetical protein